MRSRIGYLIAASFVLSLGCGDGGDNPYANKPKSKSLEDLKQSAPELTAEEQEAKRKALGIRTNDEIAAENAAIFEKGAREYVKTRLPEYREFTKEMTDHLAALEKDAAGWAGDADPNAAFDKWAEDNQEWTSDFKKKYDTLTGHGAEGGNLQATLGKSVRAWEDLLGSLSPEASKNEQFATMLTEIRKGLDEVTKTLDEIEKDDSIVIDETYAGKKAKRDKKAKEEKAAK
jgi:hypothetical protein